MALLDLHPCVGRKLLGFSVIASTSLISRHFTDPARYFEPPPGRIGSGQQDLVLKLGLVGSDQEIFKYHGSGRVWSGLVTGGFQISRVEPGLVGSGQELSKYHRSSRVWSGRVRRFPNITGRAGSPGPDPTRGKRSDPRKALKTYTTSAL